MVAIKYSLAATLLASAVVAAPVQEQALAVQERAVELGLEERALEERTLLTALALVNLLRNSANGISGGLFHLTSLTVNHEVDNVENFTNIFEELLKDIGVVVPGLNGVVQLGDTGIVNILVPGISVVVNLSVQVVTSMLDMVGQTIPKKLHDNVLWKFVELLQAGRGIVTNLSGTLTTMNVPGVDALTNLLPKIDSATTSVKMCKDKKDCTGW
ncbi:hypothetical protein CJU90_0631 [Yarrowia sp. C11]|nr:hypothetical protein CKK34_2043 [Yarrowia sp. E02]KAG5372970.1 hypothetical protein CJU90_0631 [Yarrowia sp. C11]